MNEPQPILNAASPVPRSSIWGRVFRLMRKELSEILRDRRTIATLILMPLLLYPLLSIAFQQLIMANALPAQEAIEVRLGFLNEQEHADFSQLITIAYQIDQQRAARRAKEQQQEEPKQNGAPDDSSRESVTPKMYVPDKGIGPQVIELLRSGYLDVVIRRNKARPAKKVQVSDWDIVFRKDSFQGIQGALEIEEKLAILNTTALRRLGVVGVLGEESVIVTSRTVEVERADADRGLPLESMIPLILILMTITGAVYPAIDLTAGERERGTLEILVAAPVPRMALLFAKYVSVVSVAVLTAIVNLAMMTVTVWATGLGRQLFGAQGLTPLLILQVLALLLLFAAFFSAVLLSITSFARSFKEAQAYLIPLMLVSLAPGLASLVIGRLTPELCLVPLLNVVLLGHDLLRGQVVSLHVFIVVASTILYAIGFLTIAARVFGAENVLYNEQSSWAELFSRPTKPRMAPSISNALTTLIFIFALFFIIQGLTAPQSAEEALQPMRIWLSAALLPILSILFFAGVPLMIAARRHIVVESAFQLHSASPLGFVGAILLGVSVWPLLLEMLTLMTLSGWTTIDEAQTREMVRVHRLFQTQLPLAVLLVIKVVPAFVEELFFRGYLFSALRKVTDARGTILASALLFGLFHLVTEARLGPERVLPSTLLGILLGWVCWRTGSVLPGMLLHACHNAILAWIGYSQSRQDSTGDTLVVEHLPPMWLIAGAVGTVAGLVCIYFSGRRATIPKEPLNGTAAEEK